MRGCRGHEHPFVRIFFDRPDPRHLCPDRHGQRRVHLAIADRCTADIESIFGFRTKLAAERKLLRIYRHGDHAYLHRLRSSGVPAWPDPDFEEIARSDFRYYRLHHRPFGDARFGDDWRDPPPCRIYRRADRPDHRIDRGGEHRRFQSPVGNARFGHGLPAASDGFGQNDGAGWIACFPIGRRCDFRGELSDAVGPSERRGPLAIGGNPGVRLDPRLWVRPKSARYATSYGASCRAVVRLQSWCGNRSVDAGMRAPDSGLAAVPAEIDAPRSYRGGCGVSLRRRRRTLLVCQPQLRLRTPLEAFLAGVVDSALANFG